MKCETCGYDYVDVSMYDQREAIAVLDRKGVDCYYIGDGLYKITYRHKKIYGKVMVEYRTAPKLVEISKAYEPTNTKKAGKTRTKKNGKDESVAKKRTNEKLRDERLQSTSGNTSSNRKLPDNTGKRNSKTSSNTRRRKVRSDAGRIRGKRNLKQTK